MALGAFLGAAFNPNAFLTTSGGFGGGDFGALFSAPRPRFTWSGGSLTLRLPSLTVNYELGNVGGDIESGAGVRAAFIVRRDDLVSFTFRIYESEWPSFQRFLDFAQTGASFSLYLDTDDASSRLVVTLVAPTVGSKYEVTIDPSYQRVMQFTITVMRASAVPAPPVVTPPSDLPVGILWDYEADDALFVDTPNTIEDETYHGVIQVSNRLEGGKPLTSLGSRPGYYADNDELNGHALIRSFGSSNNNPMRVDNDDPIPDLHGATLVVVHRPGAGVSHGFPFQVGGPPTIDSSTGALIALGAVSGDNTVGLWRRGDPAGDTGEFSTAWSGTTLFEPTIYPTHGVPYHFPDAIQEFFPVKSEDNVRGDAFCISIVRINMLGQISTMLNGSWLPFVFQAPPGPFVLQHMLLISSAGGSLDLSGGQAWEWARAFALGRAITNGEALTLTRQLGRRYGITTL